MLMPYFLLTACWLSVLLPTLAVAFGTATPESMNMDSAVLNDLTVALQNLTDHHFIPGATVMVARRGKLVYQATVGYPRDDMIFRIYSMTKPITTAAVLLLVQAGKLKLDDPICQHIPAFANARVITGANPLPNFFKSVPARFPITVHHLLTHTAGLVYGYSNTTVDALYRRDLLPTWFSKDATLEQFVARLARHPLLFHPGTHCWYSGSYDVLGYIVEVVSGMPFDEFLRTLLLPLGMVDTGFWVPPEKAHRLADLMFMNGTSTPSVKAPEWGFAGNNYKANPTLKLGGSGMVSTAQDYMRFLLFLYNGGMHEGRRILRADLVERFFQNALPALHPFEANGVQHKNLSFTYGPQLQLIETEASPKGEIVEGGLANTNMVVSRERELVFLTMTNKFTFPNLAARATREHVYSSQKDFPPKHGAAESVLEDPSENGLRTAGGLLRALPFLRNESPFAAQNQEAAWERERRRGLVGGGSGAGEAGERDEEAGGEDKDKVEGEDGTVDVSVNTEKELREWEIEARLD